MIFGENLDLRYSGKTGSKWTQNEICSGIIKNQYMVLFCLFSMKFQWYKYLKLTFIIFLGKILFSSIWAKGALNGSKMRFFKFYEKSMCVECMEFFDFCIKLQ